MYDYLRGLKEKKNFDPEKILDIGAWNGYWTKKVQEIWPDAEYTCIEAGPKHEKSLKQITPNYHISVLGDSNKQIKMYLREISKGNKKKVTYTKGSTIFGIFKDFEVRQMRTLDELVGSDAKFDLIKQDVQGAEIMVMKGAPDIFKRATYIIQEVNLHKDEEFPQMPDESEMDEYMLSLGFNYNEIVDNHPGAEQIDKIYFKG